MFSPLLQLNRGFPGGWVVKNLPAKQEMWALSLGWEDPLEKEMATHFSILAWKIPWTEELGRLQSMASQRVEHDWAANTFPVAQRVKNLPAVRETLVISLGLEDHLQKEMATHSSILAWRIPWTGEPGGLQSVESQIVGHDWATKIHTHTNTQLLG